MPIGEAPLHTDGRVRLIKQVLMTCDPHWTTYLSALLVPTVAVLGSIIAYRQWRTAQNKLKLDLFEKRFAVYDSARHLVSSITTHGIVINEEIYKFIAYTREAKWLLNTDIAMYLDEELYRKALHLQALDSQLAGLPVGEARSANVHTQTELKNWILQQYNVLDEKFSPFLRLEH